MSNCGQAAPVPNLLEKGPSGCPKYNTCSAPICPLDPGWRRCHHVQGEPVCQYLLASGKEGAAERYAGDPVFEVALGVVDEIAARFPSIGYEVRRAARHGFPGAHRRGLKPGRKAS